MSGFQAVGVFLFSLFFTLAIYSLWLRISMRYFRVSAVNPLNQIIEKITGPVVNSLNKMLQIKRKPGARYDWMAFAVLVFIEFLKIIILGLLTFGALVPLGYLIVFVLADLIVQPCDILFYLIIIDVVMSWINPTMRHPFLDVVRIITAPFLRFGRYIIPNISGFDFSPFVIMIFLKIITLFIRNSFPGNLI